MKPRLPLTEIDEANALRAMGDAGSLPESAEGASGVTEAAISRPNCRRELREDTSACPGVTQ